MLAWKGASRIRRAHRFWTLKMSANSPALQLAQTDTQYSRMGLILALNKIIRYLIGRNFLMRARTATRFKRFFLRFVTWFDQERVGSISRPRRRSSWACSSFLSSKKSVNAHSSQRDSFCLIPIIIYFVFSGWVTIPCSLVHVAVLLRSRWSCSWTSDKVVALA